MILTVLFIYFLHGDKPQIIDEFHHWLLMNKDLYYNDYFYITENTKTFFHYEYPPILSLLETFGLILLNDFQLDCMYYSLWIFQLSILMYAIPEKNKNSKYLSTTKRRIIFVIIFSIYIILFSFIISFAYEDSRSAFWLGIIHDTPVGLLAGLGFFLAVSKCKTKFHYLGLLILLSFIALTKEISIIFIIAIFTVLLISLKVQKNKKLSKAKIIIVCCSSVIPFMLIILWKTFYANSWSAENGLAPQFNITIDSTLQNLHTLFSGAFNESQITQINSFISNILLDVNLSSFLSLTLFGQLILLFSILIILTVINSKKKILCINSKILIISLIITTIIYTLTILYAYLFFNFSQDMIGYTLSTYRYIGAIMVTISVCIYYILTFILLSIFEKVFKPLFVTIISIVICIVISPYTFLHSLYIQNDNFYKLFNNDLREKIEQYLKEQTITRLHKEQFDWLKENIPPYSKILVDKNDIFLNLTITNYNLDTITILPYSWWVINDYIFSNNDKVIKNYDYLIIGNDTKLNNDDYYNKFGIMPENNTLYKLNKTSQGIELEKIGNIYLNNYYV